MPKETNNNEYIIAFFYAVLVFILVSEPFVYYITNKEQIRMYGTLFFMIGAVILAVMLNKKEVRNKNGKLSLYKHDEMSTTK